MPISNGVTKLLQKKSLVMFMPSFRGGGAERAMIALANEISKNDTKITLIVASDEGVYQNELSKSIEVISLGVKRVSSSVFGLKRELSRIQPDVTFSTLFNANCAALVAHRLAGRPGRLVLREANVFVYDHGWRTKLAHLFGSVLYRNASEIIAVSRAVKEELRTVMKVRESINITIIPNSIGTDDIDSLADAELKPYIPELENKRYVLGVGRFSEAKGFKCLLLAFAKLKHIPDLHLVLLGDGLQRQMLLNSAEELGIASRVHMPGFVLNPYCWMKRCSVFVLSSRYEGSPNVLIQAVGVGSQVVSTRLKGVTDDLLQNGNFGRLVPPNEHELMAQAIESSIDNPIALELDVWRLRHSKEAVAQEYMDVLFGTRNSADKVKPNV